jgi:hypothetical protein
MCSINWFVKEVVRMHLLVEAVDALRGVLTSVADVNPTFLTTVEKSTVLVELAAVQAQVAELRLRVLAAAGDVASATAARDAGAWLAVATNARRCDAAADVRLAAALESRYAVVATGMREGRVSPAQAGAIVRALDRLPAGVGPDVRKDAEQTLVGYASDFDPTELTRLGRRVLDVVAPEVGEAAEARALGDLEAAATARARLTLRALGDGTTRLSGLIPDASAARLATYLHAYTNPRRRGGTAREGLHDTDAAADAGGVADADLDSDAGGRVRESHPNKLAKAFTQLLEDLDATRLPIHGGDATTLVVTMSLDSLKADLGTATIDNGLPGDGADRITAAQARRLACRAKIIPSVLGGDSEVLDLGRARRLFSPAQNRALRLRDTHCRAEGFTIPATWCESHHWQPWSRGGRTDLDAGALLCSHHHHRVHDPDYEQEHMPNGRVRISRLTECHTQQPA